MTYGWSGQTTPIRFRKRTSCHTGALKRGSLAVDVLDGASFTIEVFKNNAGTKGDKIGQFTDNVLGYDHVEFLVVDVSGQKYFKAVSLVTIGKVLMYVLL